MKFPTMPSVIESAFAQATTTAPTAPTAPLGMPPQPSPLMSLMPFVIMMGVVYLLIIRPQQKRMKEHQNALEKLKHGDDVVTQSGIFGTITGITDKVVTLEVDKGVKLKVLKSQINLLTKTDSSKA